MKLWKHVLDFPKSKKSPYFVRTDNGLLYHRHERKGIIREQLVVPECRRRKVMEMVHDDHGHPAQKRMKQVITRNFYWPRVKQDVVAYARSCISCQKRRKCTIYDRVPIR